MIEGYDSTFSVSDMRGTDTASHGSPLFDFLTAFAPRKLKDLFRLCEYLYFNCAQVYSALTKFATYPITSITYTTTNVALRNKYTKLHTKRLRTLRALHRAAIDKYVYGNSFHSIYVPFIRFLECTKCHKQTNINMVEYKFNLKKLLFTFDCAHCKRMNVRGEVRDKKLFEEEKISIIRWDPKLMDVDYNPITGHSEYFYTIPKELKERVAKGNKHVINTMPMEFLKTLQDDKIFKFNEGEIFHMKMDAPAGIEAQWGFPPLASTIKLFFYAAVLRKANEAIALDYVVPMRIISPRAASSNGDPVMQISLETWSANMKESVKKWRRDPLHIMWSPIPCDVTFLGGQARALLTLGEVQTAEDNIIAALGIPKEFIYGGFSALGSGIQLRVLENQLIFQTGDIKDFLQWLSDRIGRLLGWELIETDLAPFKFIDDVQQKTLLLQLNAASPDQQPWISKKTLGEPFDIDPDKEGDLLDQETLAGVRRQQKLQMEIQKLQNTLAAQVQAQQAMGSQAIQYDQQAVIAQADQLVQQMQGFDPGTRRSQLHALQAEDAVMYAVVTMRLRDADTQSMAAMKQQQQSGGQDPTSGQ